MALMSCVKNTGEPDLSCGRRAGREPLSGDGLGSAPRNEGANNDAAVIPSPAARNLRRLGIAESPVLILIKGASGRKL